MGYDVIASSLLNSFLHVWAGQHVSVFFCGYEQTEYIGEGKEGRGERRQSEKVNYRQRSRKRDEEEEAEYKIL